MQFDSGCKTYVSFIFEYQRNHIILFKFFLVNKVWEEKYFKYWKIN